MESKRPITARWTKTTPLIWSAQCYSVKNLIAATQHRRRSNRMSHSINNSSHSHRHRHQSITIIVNRQRCSHRMVCSNLQRDWCACVDVSKNQKAFSEPCSWPNGSIHHYSRCPKYRYKNVSWFCPVCESDEWPSTVCSTSANNTKHTINVASRFSVPVSKCRHIFSIVDYQSIYKSYSNITMTCTCTMPET